MTLFRLSRARILSFRMSLKDVLLKVIGSRNSLVRLLDATKFEVELFSIMIATIMPSQRECYETSIVFRVASPNTSQIRTARLRFSFELGLRSSTLVRNRSIARLAFYSIAR